jgi:hypothetical protein
VVAFINSFNIAPERFANLFEANEAFEMLTSCKRFVKGVDMNEKIFYTFFYFLLIFFLKLNGKSTAKLGLGFCKKREDFLLELVAQAFYLGNELFKILR